MGRMLEALKRAGSGRRPALDAERPDPPGPAAAVADAPPTLVADETDAEVPFIEVGPAGAVLGSPDVLATRPFAPAGGKAPGGPRVLPLTPVPSPPRGRGEDDGTPSAPLLRGSRGEEEGPSPALGAQEGSGHLPAPPVGPSSKGKPHFAPTFRPAPSPPPRPVAFRPLPAGLVEDPADLAPELVAYHDPDHPVSGQYRDLLAALTAAAPGVRAPALLFTSAAAGAGTTTVLLNVAVTAARQGRRTAVVDANLRRPALAERLGVEGRPGLREVLAGELTLEEAVLPTRQPSLAVLPAGGAPGTPPGRFPAETLRSLLRRLRQRFDLVLVDGPRWDGRTEVAVLGAACDAAYLVTAGDDSPQTNELLHIIPGQGVRLAGCVVAGGGIR